MLPDERNYVLGDYGVEHDTEDFSIRNPEGEYIVTVQFRGAAPEKMVRDLIRAYKRGVEIGEEAGARLARQHMRQALGIE